MCVEDSILQIWSHIYVTKRFKIEVNKDQRPKGHKHLRYLLVCFQLCHLYVSCCPFNQLHLPNVMAILLILNWHTLIEFGNKLQIDALIDSYHYWQVVTWQIIQGHGGLTAIYTCLGRVLSAVIQPSDTLCLENLLKNF